MFEDPIHLFDEYYIKSVPWKTLLEFRNAHESIVFTASSFFRPQTVMNEGELETYNRVKSNYQKDRFRLNLFYYKNEEIVGWHQGYQDGIDSFYMQNTGILPEHRNKKIYSKSLPFILGFLKESGFQVVTSKHISSNNPIIVSKLKAGFKIAGFEVSDKYGLMIKLAHFFNSKRNEVFEFRAGGFLQSSELQDFFLKPPQTN